MEEVKVRIHDAEKETSGGIQVMPKAFLELEDFDLAESEDSEIFGPPRLSAHSPNVSYRGFETYVARVLLRRPVLEVKEGLVWHFVVQTQKRQSSEIRPTAWAIANKSDAGFAIGGLFILPFIWLLILSWPYLTDPIGALGRLIYNLELACYALIALGTLYGLIWALWQKMKVLAGIALFSGFLALYLVVPLLALLEFPKVSPADPEIGYAEYFTEFVSLQSQAMAYFAPVLPLLALMAQAIGMKFLGTFVSELGGMAKPDGSLNEYIKGVNKLGQSAVITSLRPQKRP